MLLALAFLGVCSLHGHGSRSSDVDNQIWRASWETSDCNVMWTSNGDVTFTDDGMDVAKVGPDVKLTVVEMNDGHTRRVVFTERSGMLNRDYDVDGKMHDWDASAGKWFAAMLVELDHQTGKLAPIRFKQLMTAGGPSAVFEDMRSASGNAQATYARMLLQSGKLGAADACHIAGFAGDISADHEKADILTDVASQVDFSVAECRDAYFGAVRKISGDYERARAEIAAIEHAPASGPALNAFAVAALSVAREIASDHEKEHVLVTFAPRCTGDSARTAYLATARTIASDAERARALTALVRQQ
ncbi:MAG TPA: hypothetical protein VFA43_12325 [Gemmatimonadaceae bacterium]|nr:hypothetical protein [Gemmatimonadaceae bacterium]